MDILSGWIVSTIVVAVLCYREWCNAKMISMLLDRLMSRNLPEFKVAIGAATRPVPIKRAFKTDEDLAVMEDERNGN